MISANLDFDLASSVQTRLLREDAALQLGSVALFDLSPLTSPDPTPPPSPQIISAPPLPNLTSDVNAEGPSSSSRPPPPPIGPPLPTRKALLTPSSKAKDRKAAKKVAGHAQRSRRRAAAEFGSYKVRQKAVEKYIGPADSIPCGMTMEAAPVQSTGFVAKDDGTRPRKEYYLDEMIGEASKFKFRLEKWDGHTPTSIVDKSHRLVAVLAGRPNVEKWPVLHQQAAAALEERRSLCFIPKDKRKHRRGRFVALQCGVSHGGGQAHPRNMTNDPQNERILNELSRLEPFKRMAGFASACMATWAPNLYKYYADHMRPLYKNDPSLKPVFPSCIFSAATYNFGPKTVCYKHRDFGNLPFGLCAVWSLGSFDPTKGGHLILWDCHLVIEFPPGSAILLPSAIVAHSNTLIAPHERRYSFALYTAGALFRWVSNNFMTADNHRAKLSAEQLEVEKQKNDMRWKNGLALLPILTLGSEPVASSFTD